MTPHHSGTFWQQLPEILPWSLIHVIALSAASDRAIRRPRESSESESEQVLFRQSNDSEKSLRTAKTRTQMAFDGSGFAPCDIGFMTACAQTEDDSPGIARAPAKNRSGRTRSLSIARLRDSASAIGRQFL